MMSSPDAAAPIVVSVCTTCRAEGSDEKPGERLLARLRERADPTILVVRAVQCLSVCKRPCTAALAGPDRYTYVFGDLDPETGAEALLAGAATYAAAEHGYMPWRERPEPLRRGIVARIPPLGWSPDDGGHPR